MQGYHFSKPVGASELETFLAARAEREPAASP